MRSKALMLDSSRFMVQSWSTKSVPATTSYAFRSHPRRVFSISYLLTGFFHGANAGSNPAGDAKLINSLRAILRSVSFMVPITPSA
jgi:hypothetical protein